MFPEQLCVHAYVLAAIVDSCAHILFQMFWTVYFLSAEKVAGLLF